MDIIDAQKFGEHYKKTIADSDKSYLIKYHMHRYALKHLTDSQIIDSFDAPWCNNEELCEVFRETSKIWQKVIEKQLNDAAKQIMTSHSLSIGEAMIIADEEFDKQIGYVDLFLRNFTILMEMMRMAKTK